MEQYWMHWILKPVLRQVRRYTHYVITCFMVYGLAMNDSVLQWLCAYWRLLCRKSKSGRFTKISLSFSGQSGMQSLYEVLFSQYHLACSQILTSDTDFKVPEVWKYSLTFSCMWSPSLSLYIYIYIYRVIYRRSDIIHEWWWWSSW